MQTGVRCERGGCRNYANSVWFVWLVCKRIFCKLSRKWRAIGYFCKFPYLLAGTVFYYKNKGEKKMKAKSIIPIKMRPTVIHKRYRKKSPLYMRQSNRKDKEIERIRYQYPSGRKMAHKLAMLHIKTKIRTVLLIL